MIKELNYYLTTNRFSEIVEDFNNLIHDYSNSFGKGKTGDAELREKTRLFCEEQLVKSGIRNQDNSFINVDAEFFDNGQLVEANCNRFIKDVIKAHSYQKILWEYMGTTGLMTNISKDKMKTDGFNYQNYLPVSLKEKEVFKNKKAITRNFTKLKDNSGFAWNRGYNPNDKVIKHGWKGAFDKDGVWNCYKTDDSNPAIKDNLKLPLIRIVKTEHGCMLYDAGNLLFDPVLLFYLTQNDEVYGGKKTDTAKILEEIKIQMAKLNVKTITQVYTSDKQHNAADFKKVLGSIADENLATIDSSTANQIIKQTKDNEKAELLKKESSELQNKINVLIKAKPGITSEEIALALESNLVQVPVVSSKKDDASVVKLSDEEFQMVSSFAKNLSGKEKKTFYDSCAVLSANWSLYKSSGISKSDCIEHIYNFIKEKKDYDFSYEISLKEIIENSTVDTVKFSSTGNAGRAAAFEECVKTFMPSENQNDALAYIKSLPEQKPEVKENVYSALYNAIKNYQTIRMSTGMSIKELFDYAVKHAHGTLPKASFVPPVSGYITPNAKTSVEADATGAKRIYFENKISALYEMLKKHQLPQKKVSLNQLEKDFAKFLKDEPAVQLKINSARDFEMLYPVVDELFSKLHGPAYFEFLKDYLDSIEQNAEKVVGDGLEIKGRTAQIKPVFSQVDFAESSDLRKGYIELPANMHVMKSKATTGSGIEQTHIISLRKNLNENINNLQTSPSQKITAEDLTLLLNNISKTERIAHMEYVNKDDSLLSPLYGDNGVDKVTASISVKPAQKEELLEKTTTTVPPVLHKPKSKSLSAEEKRMARLNSNYEKDRAALAKTDPAFMAKNQFFDVGHAEGSGELLTRDVEKLAERQSEEYLKDVKGMNV